MPPPPPPQCCSTGWRTVGGCGRWTGRRRDSPVGASAGWWGGGDGEETTTSSSFSSLGGPESAAAAVVLYRVRRSRRRRRPPTDSRRPTHSRTLSVFRGLAFVPCHKARARFVNNNIIITPSSGHAVIDIIITYGSVRSRRHIRLKLVSFC